MASCAAHRPLTDRLDAIYKDPHEGAAAFFAQGNRFSVGANDGRSRPRTGALGKNAFSRRTSGRGTRCIGTLERTSGPDTNI
jgi:hypothetical protein